jgi:hypothetical protein
MYIDNQIHPSISSDNVVWKFYRKEFNFLMKTLRTNINSPFDFLHILNDKFDRVHRILWNEYLETKKRLGGS